MSGVVIRAALVAFISFSLFSCGSEDLKNLVSPESTSAPATPTGVTATAGNGQATIAWPAVSDATSYNIYMSTTNGVTPANGTKIAGVASPYARTGLNNGTTYYFVVTAVNANGESQNSSQVSATPAAPPPGPTFSISGAVSGAVLQGVKINLTGAATKSATTDASGNYVFSGLSNGSHTITPILAGYTFSPASRTITVSGADSTGNNFTSTSVPSQSYLYFKRSGTTTPQTATLSNGTLSIDGKNISGVYVVTSLTGVDCLAGGTGNILTACWSPYDTPHTMLLCGPDPVTGAADTLLYVLFDSPDANRVSSNATLLLNALQSEKNYVGTGVYTDCSGSAYTAWIRNYPDTNYYLWPDVFTTYSGAYVSNLLSGAVIYSTPTAGNNYNEYVAVRDSGSTFEVWH